LREGFPIRGGMMGERGPRPTPTAILEQRGSDLVRDRRNEPQPEKGHPDVPDWLDSDAKVIWHQVCTDLDSMGVLTKVDGGALARYCRLFVRWKQADKFIRDRGEMYPTKNKDGDVTSFQQFPQVGIVNKLSVELLKIEREFGLTPSSRARIQVDVKPSGETTGKERFFRVTG